MDTNGRAIWQIAAGDTDRSYEDLFLRWDVILNGPGDFGKWPDCKSDLRKVDWVSSRKITDVERFCTGIQNGDFVVLRMGTSSVLGFGQVVGGYEFQEIFSDVDGWDLQHTRRVRWLWKHDGNPAQFDTYALKLGDTTQILDSKPVEEWIRSLDVPELLLSRPLIELPHPQNSTSISIDKISEYLFDQGVASGSIQKLTNEMDELVRIARWYQRSNYPSEHETVAYLVVPLLRALGWTPQRMAIEWNRVDIALFDSLPRMDESLAVVVEVKKMGKSCLSALSQAMSYSQGKENCKRLIVTDGLRYGLHTKDTSGDYKLHSYMNLTDLRDSYPIYDSFGAKEALLTMAPEWRS